jgi:hypothetical protein
MGITTSQLGKVSYRIQNRRRTGRSTNEKTTMQLNSLLPNTVDWQQHSLHQDPFGMTSNKSGIEPISTPAPIQSGGDCNGNDNGNNDSGNDIGIDSANYGLAIYGAATDNKAQQQLIVPNSNWYLMAIHEPFIY